MTRKAATDWTTRKTTDTDQFSFGTMATDLLSTTWRIAVPVTLFALAGITIDNHQKTAPWCTLVGVVIGFGMAVLLLKRQLQQVDQQDSKKGKAS